jgi:magnesium transporter
VINQVNPPNSAFIWLDVVSPSEEEMNQLAVQYNLHPAAVQDCLQPDHLPKYELFDDIHFIITRYFDKQASKRADSFQQLSHKLSIFYSHNLIITVHRLQFEPYDEIKTKYKDHPVLFDILCKIIKTTLASFESPVHQLDNDVEFYESRIFLKKKIPDLLKSLYLIKHRIYVFRKLINLSNDAIERIGQIQKRTPGLQDLRDYYVRLDTMTEDVHESIQSLLSIYFSLSSQRANEVMRTLTVFTAFFLPLTFIVGVYGMNFKYMPELEQPWGYPASLGLMFALTVIIYIWFRRRGWL